MAYTTLADVKLYLGIEADDDDDDALLESLIPRAQAIIDKEARHTFEAATDTTRYYDLRDVDGCDLWLGADLCQITSVTNGDGTVVTASEYTTQPRNDKPWFALRMKTGAWNATDGEIAVTGRWAFSVTAEANIQHAAVRMVAWLYRQKDNHADSDRVALVGDMTLLPGRLPNDVLQYLRPYFRVVP